MKPNSDEIVTASLVGSAKPTGYVCLYCGGATFSPPTRLGWVEDPPGPRYYPGAGLWGFRPVSEEPLFAEICQDCGTLARLFVKNPRREWVVKP